MTKPKIHHISFRPGEFMVVSRAFLFLTEALTQKIRRSLTTVQVMPRIAFG